MSDATNESGNAAAALRDLLDKEAIREVIGIRYARGLDWYDIDMLKSCFHEDAMLDYGYFKGNAHEWATMRVVKGNPDELHRFHYCFPPLIEITGDRAQCESNSYAGYRKKDGDGQVCKMFGARYIDTVERRNGLWKISFRAVLVDFLQDIPSPAGFGGLQKGMGMLEHLRPDHPLYHRLGKPD